MRDIRLAVSAQGTQQATTAIRAVVRGEVQGVGFRDATVRRARQLGVMGWVRNGEEGAGRSTQRGLCAPPRFTPRAPLAPSRSTPRVPRPRSRSWWRFCGKVHRSPGSRRSRSPRCRSRTTSSSRYVASPPGCSSCRSTLARGPPLRPAPGGRRGDALVGGAEGALAGPGREAPRGAGRRPRDLAQLLRGRARRGAGDRLGSRRLRAGWAGRMAGRRWSAATPCSCCTARSCAAASRCSAPAGGRRRSGF